MVLASVIIYGHALLMIKELYWLVLNSSVFGRWSAQLHEFTSVNSQYNRRTVNVMVSRMPVAAAVLNVAFAGCSALRQLLLCTVLRHSPLTSRTNVNVDQYTGIHEL